MIRIQFNNQKCFMDVSFKLLSDTSILISSEKEMRENNSGFKAYRLNGNMLGDYSDYKKCKKTKQGLVFEKESV